MRAKYGYRYVNHTADVKFIAYGRERDTLFRNAALALFDIMADTAAVKRLSAVTNAIGIRVSADSEETLLWRFLQRCLSQLEVHGVFAYMIEGLHVSENEKTGKLVLGCSLKCKGMNPECSKLEAKGISKYDMRITRASGTLRASVVVDV